MVSRIFLSFLGCGALLLADYGFAQPKPDVARIEGKVVFSSVVSNISVDGEFLNVKDSKGNFASIPRTNIEKDKERRMALKDDCVKLALFSKATGAKFIVVEDDSGSGFASALSVRNCSVE
jgi:hypothetical protein